MDVRTYVRARVYARDTINPYAFVCLCIRVHAGWLATAKCSNCGHY